MNNIFENAYFGKTYKTRDGRKAIFYMATKLGACLLSEKFGLQLYHFDGTSFMKCSKSDIVSEWQNSFDEDKMNTTLNEADKLRETAKGRSETGGWYWRKWAEWGYRKALETNK